MSDTLNYRISCKLYWPTVVTDLSAVIQQHHLKLQNLIPQSTNINTFQFGEIQKLSRKARQADKSNNKFTVNFGFPQKVQDLIIHFYVILKTHIVLF